VATLLGDEERLPSRWLFGEWGTPKRRVRAVWNRRYRLLRFDGNGEPIFELYDRQDDLAEVRSVHGDEPDAVARMDEILRERYRAVDLSGSEPAAGPEMEPDVEERLRALGYL
jgi:hypothetical protein